MSRRLGMERVLLASMLVLAAGILLRSAGAAPALFLGTAVLGAGIAIGNVLLPGLVKREFPERVGLMTSTYSTVLAVSAAIAAGASFPVAGQVAASAGKRLWPCGPSSRSWPPRLGCPRSGTLVARTPPPQLPRGLVARGARPSPGR
jgi:cyanate permease